MEIKHLKNIYRERKLREAIYYVLTHRKYESDFFFFRKFLFCLNIFEWLLIYKRVWLENGRVKFNEANHESSIAEFQYMLYDTAK